MSTSIFIFFCFFLSLDDCINSVHYIYCDLIMISHDGGGGRQIWPEIFCLEILSLKEKEKLVVCLTRDFGIVSMKTFDCIGIFQ